MLPIDAAGFVPWWPQPEVMLMNVIVHFLTDTSRHAGHADILREQLDDAYGATPAAPEEDWEEHRALIELAARKASGTV